MECSTSSTYIVLVIFFSEPFSVRFSSVFVMCFGGATLLTNFADDMFWMYLSYYGGYLK